MTAFVVDEVWWEVVDGAFLLVGDVFFTFGSAKTSTGSGSSSSPFSFFLAS